MRKPLRKPEKPKCNKRNLKQLVTVTIIILAIVWAYSLFETRQKKHATPAFAVQAQQAQDYYDYGEAREKKRPPVLTSLVQNDDSYIIVWLDAGHGGTDAGTYVIVDGTRVYEKDIALDIVLLTYEMFQQSNHDIRIYLTRDSDTHMFARYRPNQWNQTPYTVRKADLVVSIHADFYEGRTAQSVSGIRSYYNQNKIGNSGRVDISANAFAQILQDHLVATTGARDRGVNGHTNLLIPQTSTMPAVLIEVGFMSNYDELALLMTHEYRYQIATALYNGIVAAVS